MEKSKSDLNRWFNIFKNKYFIASFLFIAWIIFFDENSFMVHIENKRRLKELQMQKEYYKERIAEDTKKFEELNAGMNQLEKFAREQFLMSAPGEEIFVVVPED
jgi:cell division protein DivIC